VSVATPSRPGFRSDDAGIVRQTLGRAPCGPDREGETDG